MITESEKNKIMVRVLVPRSMVVLALLNEDLSKNGIDKLVAGSSDYAGTKDLIYRIRRVLPPDIRLLKDEASGEMGFRKDGGGRIGQQDIGRVLENFPPRAGALSELFGGNARVDQLKSHYKRPVTNDVVRDLIFSIRKKLPEEFEIQYSKDKRIYSLQRRLG